MPGHLRSTAAPPTTLHLHSFSFETKQLSLYSGLGAVCPTEIIAFSDRIQVGIIMNHHNIKQGSVLACEALPILSSPTCVDWTVQPQGWFASSPDKSFCARQEFKEVGVEVLGVSVDSAFSHLAWVNQPRKQGGLGGLAYPLISDITKSISKDYGVLIEEGESGMPGAWNGGIGRAPMLDM